MRGNAGPNSPGHLADLFGDAAQDMASGGSAGSRQMSGDTARPAEQGRNGQTGESKACDGNRVAGQFFDLVDLGLSAGIHGRPFLGAHGIDEDNAGDFLRIAERITAHDQAAEGVTDENVRRPDAGAVQQVVQFRGTVAGGARSAAGAAPAKAAAIVGDGVGEAGHGFLNVEPVQIGRGNAGLNRTVGPPEPFSSM